MEQSSFRKRPAISTSVYVQLMVIISAIGAEMLQPRLIPWGQSLTSLDNIGWIILPLAKLSLEVGPAMTFLLLWGGIVGLGLLLGMTVRAFITVWRFMFPPKRTANS